MARNKRYEKNLAKVQSMLDGDFKSKIQVGTHNPKSVHSGRKVGDKWTDSDGVEWEQKEGYRSKIRRMPDVGMFSKQCKDCNTPCIKKFDKDTYNRMGRCYKCQVHFEEELKWNRKNKIGKNNNKHFFWVKLMNLKRWDAIDKEVKQLIFDNHEQNKKKVWDKSVANAMSNANVEMSIKQNKS